jgi:small subunit ribosomal protein S16
LSGILGFPDKIVSLHLYFKKCYMPVKIRLARHGRKGIAYYHIVVADSRAPRDGRFIEQIGIYNPNTNPASIKLDFDKALTWTQNGAVATGTCRAILSYEGVLYKDHLMRGVKKGAFDEATAEQKFQAWKQEKLGKIEAKRDRLTKEITSDQKKRFANESKVKEARAESIAKKNAELAEASKKAAEEAVPETPEETTPDTGETTQAEV